MTGGSCGRQPDYRPADTRLDGTLNACGDVPVPVGIMTPPIRRGRNRSTAFPIDAGSACTMIGSTRRMPTYRATPPGSAYSIAWCDMAAGSRPAKSQPTAAANAGMATRMRRRSPTGTFSSAAIPPFSELPRSHPIMPM
jgi:hypothetical protein